MIHPMTTTTRPLGKTQKAILRSMARAHASNEASRTWYDGCGWVWTTAKETTKLMESLVRRGLVEKTVTHISATNTIYGRDHV
jgi:hypothetical protein